MSMLRLATLQSGRYIWYQNREWYTYLSIITWSHSMNAYLQGYGFDCLFTEFEVVALNRLKISPSQLCLGLWEGVLQLCVKYNSQEPTIGLFFNLFHPKGTSLDNFQDQGLLQFHLIIPWFGSFVMDGDDFLRNFFIGEAPHLYNSLRSLIHPHWLFSIFLGFVYEVLV